MSATPSTDTTTQRVVAVTVRVALKQVLGIDLTVGGDARVPADGSIIAHNLLSPLDAFIVALALQEAGHPHPVVMMREEMHRVPLLTHLLSAGALTLGAEPASDGVLDVNDAFGLAWNTLLSGRPLLTAPEDAVSESLEVATLEDTCVRLALSTNVPVIPTATFGSHRLFDETGKLRLRRRGVPVSVTFGNPIPPDAIVNIPSATRTLKMDLQGLLSQTLTDYPDRDQADGQWWWPASVGGTAPCPVEPPSVFGVPADPILDPLPRAESTLSQRFPRRTPVKVEDMPPLRVPPPLDLPPPPWEQESDGETRLVQPATAFTTATPILSHTASSGARSATALAEPPAADPDCHLHIVELPQDRPEPTGPPAQNKTITGVRGVLSFALPGKPLLRVPSASIEVIGTDRLVLTSGDTKTRIEGVQVRKHRGRTVFFGQLIEEALLESGTMRMNIPAGTTTAFLAARAKAA